MTDPKDINPQGVYSFREAARLLPSCHPGKSLHQATLYRWRDAGLIKAHQSVGRGWFVFGAEILRLLHADEMPPVFPGGTRSERQKEINAAKERLREKQGL